MISAERYESYLRIMGDVLGKNDYETIFEEVALEYHKTNVKKR